MMTYLLAFLPSVIVVGAVLKQSKNVSALAQLGSLAGRSDEIDGVVKTRRGKFEFRSNFRACRHAKPCVARRKLSVARRNASRRVGPERAASRRVGRGGGFSGGFGAF